MIDETVSHYRIIERIGAGAMGDVYKAQDLELSRNVALKFLPRAMTQNKRHAERFVREAQAASSLDHPNVCTVYEIKETEDGRMFIAMAYYEGKDLRARLEEGEMPLEEAVAYALSIADGLGLAHSKQIIHRDIKPANIMVTDDGVVKILDFGLAKLSGRARVTSSGTTLGTLAYMSPEQTSDDPIDYRTDIFSLGVTLYEMITGICPFLADYEAAIVYKIINMDPTPTGQIRSGVPASLERIVAKAMEKDRDKRYQRMADMRDDLLEVLREIAPNRALRFESLRRRVGARKTLTRLRYGVTGFLVLAAVVVGALNWGTICRTIGLCGLGETKGIVVLPAQAQDRSEDALRCAGFGVDLAQRVQEMTSIDDGLWVVPASVMRQYPIDVPAQASRAYGVDAVLTFAFESDGDNRHCEVQLLDANTAQPIDGFSVSTADSPTWHIDVTQQLADVLEVDSDAEEIESITRGLSRSPEAFELFILGLGHLALPAAARADSAVAAFDRAIAVDSSFACAYVGRARAYLAKYQSTEEPSWAEAALADCRAALRHDSTRGEAYTVRGEVLSATGEIDQAFAAWARSVELNPRDPVTSGLLGNKYVEFDQYDKAENVYRGAIDANPRYWGGYAGLGYLYYSQGKLEEAIAEFERVAQLAPDHAPTYYYLGVFYFYLERWDEGIVNSEKSFALDKNYTACSNLGTMYYMTGRMDDAARMFEWAHEYDPSNHEVLGNLAAAYLWMPDEDKKAKARELYAQAVELGRKELRHNPNNAYLLALIADYYSAVDPDSAVTYAERALALEPENPYVLYKATTVYEYTDNRPRALMLLGKAIQHGYSMKYIAHDRQLQDLREDPRYEMLIAEVKEVEN